MTTKSTELLSLYRGAIMTKLIKAVWSLITPENAPLAISAMFFIFTEYLDALFFYPLAVISFLTWCVTKSICEAIRRDKDD